MTPRRRLHRLSLRTAPLALLLVAPLYSCAPSAPAAEPTTKPDPKTAANPPATGEKPATGTQPGTPVATNPEATPPSAGTNVPPAGSPPGAIGKYGFVKPATVKGIYLTAWSAGGTKKMDKMFALLDATELNSVVIDVRDSGEMYWKTGIPLADSTGATQVAVVKPEPLFQRLKKHEVWPIARVAIFRDNFVPKKYPKRAVQRLDGSIWRDRSGNSWLDPYNKENWEYIAQTVDFALDTGFPEIQLDYVRFPSEGKMSSMNFPGRKSYDDPKAHPSKVIADFCKFIRERVKAKGGQYTADIFGIISSSTTTDQGIGQSLEAISEPFDVICPMVYPSHYANGEYGVANPNKQPYAIVKKSLADYKKRVPDAKVRPWLQDFSLFGVKYGAAEVKAQIKAARELGYDEYLLWNAGNRYTAAALGKDEPAGAEKPAATPGAAPGAR
ncbi:MAG: putative glycoside hydrolase [Fimbriimonas sp.]